MLKIFRKDSLTPQTERIYKVPLFHRLGSCLIPLDATERLRALHSYYRMGDEASFSFNWNEYLHLKRDWRNDIINTSLREHPEYLEMEGGSCACVMFIRKYPNGLTDQFLNELTNMDFPIIYSMDVEPLDNDVAYQMVMKKYMSNERSINREQELKTKMEIILPTSITRGESSKEIRRRCLTVFLHLMSGFFMWGSPLW